jgi:hypothetical protein
VLPSDFHLPALFQGFDVRRPDIWLPLNGPPSTPPQETNRINYVIARLRDGASIQQARAEMAVIARGPGNSNTPRSIPVSLPACFRSRWKT